MCSAVSIRQATVGDALRLWLNMRPIDMEEAEIVGGAPVLWRLIRWVMTTEVVTLRRGKTVLALYGAKAIGDYSDGFACIWMLATRDAEASANRPHVFNAASAYVDECLQRFRIVGNAVYAKNHGALRFVERLGFAIDPPIVIAGALFHPIARAACAESSRE